MSGVRSTFGDGAGRQWEEPLWYFEGIRSERGIAWRVAGSPALPRFYHSDWTSQLRTTFVAPYLYANDAMISFEWLYPKEGSARY
jgi:hypothetical protein